MRISVTVPRSDNPLLQLAADQGRARAAGDPCAERCVLATVTDEGGPALRTLVLRGLAAGRLEVFFNASSPKWRQLQTNPRYELLVYWPSIARQYRISGGFEQITHAELARSWKHKGSVGKQLDIYYSKYRPQSSELESRREFDKTMGDIRATIAGGDEPDAPASLRGLRLLPWSVELLDLSGGDEMHRRDLYTNDGSGWQVRSLVP